MYWNAKSTGNMTLAICEGKRVVLRINMLKQNTLKAGDECNRLCLAMNDLFLIAESSSIGSDIDCVINRLPYKEVGNSPRPWKVILSEKKLTIRDAVDKQICDKTITKGNYEQVKADYYVLIGIANRINQYFHNTSLN